MSEKSDLKRAGLKTTQPRLKILDILENSPIRHLGADDIYKSLQGTGEQIGLATVYRVLTQFESAGLVIPSFREKSSSLNGRDNERPSGSIVVFLLFFRRETLIF